MKSRPRNLQAFLQLSDLSQFGAMVFQAPDGGHFVVINQIDEILRYFDDDVRERIRQVERDLAAQFLAKPGRRLGKVAELTASAGNRLMIIFSLGCPRLQDNGTFAVVASSPMAKDYLDLYLYHGLSSSQHGHKDKAWYDRATPAERAAHMSAVRQCLAELTLKNP